MGYGDVFVGGVPSPRIFAVRLPHIIPFGKAPLYFFTACTAGRRSALAGQLALDVLVKIWHRSAEFDGWHVGRFVLMPEHVHFFAMPETEAKPREEWIKMWKSVSSRQMLRQLNLEAPFWQNDTFDHILRSTESYREKWDYVRQNPVRAGLCATAEDWPWQGEITSLRYE